jgi:hypothetical protein
MSQFSVGTEARLEGGSARAERLVSELPRPGGVARRPAPLRRGGQECQRIGDSGLDPVGKDLPDMARIIRVAIEMLVGRLELGIQGGAPDGHSERQEKDDPKDTSQCPAHARMLAREEAWIALSVVFLTENVLDTRLSSGKTVGR